MIGEFKAKDIFKLVEVHEQAIAFVRDQGGDSFDLPRDVQPIQALVKKWIGEQYSKLMPQEVIITLNMSRSEEFWEPAQRYIISELTNMQLNELAQLFFSLLSKWLVREKTLLKQRHTDSEKKRFLQFLDDIAKYFEKNFDRLDDKSLAFILTAQVQMRNVTGEVLFKRLTNPTALRNLILKVLSQQNFEAKYYSIILG